MLDKTKALLDSFYGPFNKRLVELLGNGKFLWDELWTMKNVIAWRIVHYLNFEKKTKTPLRALVVFKLTTVILGDEEFYVANIKRNLMEMKLCIKPQRWSLIDKQKHIICSFSPIFNAMIQELKRRITYFNGILPWQPNIFSTDKLLLVGVCCVKGTH